MSSLFSQFFSKRAQIFPGICSLFRCKKAYLNACKILVKKALILQTETSWNISYPPEFHNWQERDSLRFSGDIEKIKWFNSCMQSYKISSGPSTIEFKWPIHIHYTHNILHHIIQTIPWLNKLLCIRFLSNTDKYLLLQIYSIAIDL